MDLLSRVLRGWFSIFIVVIFLTCILRISLRAAPQAEPAKGDDRAVWERPSRFCYLILDFDIKHVEKARYSPGYFDPDTRTIHRWKGVSFPVEKCIYDGIYQRVRDIEASEGRKVVEYDPDPIYLKLEGGKATVGYYGLGRQDFYRWKDVIIDQSEIPEDALKAEERVFPVGKFKEKTTEVEAPKHLLDKPALWKKVK